jgi:hypothetical protein
METSKRLKNKAAKYQYQYDSKGKTIGVFIPIKEWTAISKQYKGLSQEKVGVSKEKQKIKNDIVKALKEVENHRKGKVKLQTAKDFINEMRKELK